jgi:ectoine hydroxylase-related dioxygenase (phytanoyl-CoA dioxygenase family)
MEIYNQAEFQRNGYVIFPQLIEQDLIRQLQKAIAKYTTKCTIKHSRQSAYGIRDLDRKIPEIKNLAFSSLLLTILQKYSNSQELQLIKAIFFNKNINHNWLVSWHQDKTIAVKEKISLPNFKNWTVKQGVPHAQPPLEILEKIITIRIALNNTDCHNGALKIIPQSHQLGILDRQEIEQITNLQTPLICSLKAGDALIMHPLILHSSSKSLNQSDRGTIHLEYIPLLSLSNFY